MAAVAEPTLVEALVDAAVIMVAPVVWAIAEDFAIVAMEPAAPDAEVAALDAEAAAVEAPGDAAPDAEATALARVV